MDLPLLPCKDPGEGPAVNRGGKSGRGERRKMHGKSTEKAAEKTGEMAQKAAEKINDAAEKVSDRLNEK